MERGRLRKELLEGGPLVELPLQSGEIIAREPADDLVHLGFRAVLLLRLLHVVGIHAGKGGRENSMTGHGRGLRTVTETAAARRASSSPARRRYASSISFGSLHAVPVKLTLYGAGFGLEARRERVRALRPGTGTNAYGTVTVG